MKLEHRHTYVSSGGSNLTRYTRCSLFNRKHYFCTHDKSALSKCTVTTYRWTINSRMSGFTRLTRVSLWWMDVCSHPYKTTFSRNLQIFLVVQVLPSVHHHQPHPTDHIIQCAVLPHVSQMYTLLYWSAIMYSKEKPYPSSLGTNWARLPRCTIRTLEEGKYITTCAPYCPSLHVQLF